jgi:hypothetical protein
MKINSAQDIKIAILSDDNTKIISGLYAFKRFSNQLLNDELLNIKIVDLVSSKKVDIRSQSSWVIGRFLRKDFQINLLMEQLDVETSKTVIATIIASLGSFSRSMPNPQNSATIKLLSETNKFSNKTRAKLAYAELLTIFNLITASEYAKLNIKKLKFEFLSKLEELIGVG